MKLTWEYYSETGQKISISIEPDAANMMIVNDFARLIGVLGKDQVLFKRSLQDSPKATEEPLNED